MLSETKYCKSKEIYQKKKLIIVKVLEKINAFGFCIQRMDLISFKFIPSHLKDPRDASKTNCSSIMYFNNDVNGTCIFNNLN